MRKPIYVNVGIQIQHLLKLNEKFMLTVVRWLKIQIQHLLKLNLLGTQNLRTN